jgi:hypothetical protein
MLTERFVLPIRYPKVNFTVSLVQKSLLWVTRFSQSIGKVEHQRILSVSIAGGLLSLLKNNLDNS